MLQKVDVETVLLYGTNLLNDQLDDDRASVSSVRSTRRFLKRRN